MYNENEMEGAVAEEGVEEKDELATWDEEDELSDVEEFEIETDEEKTDENY